MADRSDITPELCRQLLNYDPETGRFCWKGKPEDWPSDDENYRQWARKGAGCPALTVVDRKGYLHGAIRGKWLFAHRAAWVITYGVWPDQIDHINGDKADNRLINLRNVSNAENMRNKSVYRNSKSGLAGVRQEPSSRKWRARINGKTIGTYPTADAAVAARAAVQQGLGFHPNHGRSK